MGSPFHKALCALLLAVSCAQLTAEIYQWTDEDGQVHFSDSDVLPPGASKAEIGPVNILPPPLLAPQPEPEVTPAPAPPTPVMTASSWASEHCEIRLRILYTERYYIPCVPTDEVQVFICEREPPRRFRNYFGRQYRYEDRESECGPEVFEGELLYMKRR